MLGDSAKATREALNKMSLAGEVRRSSPARSSPPSKVDSPCATHLRRPWSTGASSYFDLKKSEQLPMLDRVLLGVAAWLPL